MMGNILILKYKNYFIQFYSKLFFSPFKYFPSNIKLPFASYSFPFPFLKSFKYSPSNIKYPS